MPKLSKEQRQQSLTAARRAAEWLGKYGLGKYNAHSPDLECLLREFKRLDGIEQKQIRAGKRYGKLGAQYGSKAPAPGKKPEGSKK